LLGWINVRIADEDTPEIERLLTDPGDLAGELVAFVQRGFDIGVKWQDGGKSVMAYLIGQCSDDPSGSVGLSAFGEDAWSSVACLVFKYYVRLGEQLPKPENSGVRRFG